MGNHSVGEAFAAAAEVFWLVQGTATPSKDVTLAALDVVGERFRGADAEFDDYLRPDEPLGRMVAIAFDATPEEIADEETEDESPWYEGPETRFRERYGFC